MQPGLAESLKRETGALHRQVERSALMQTLLRGQLDRTGYGALLRNLHAIYAALEPALARHAHHALLAPLQFAALPREPALRRDLDALYGESGCGPVSLQAATARYSKRLCVLDAAHPHLLVAHSYVRYLGDLSGGQMLARIVRRSLDLPVGTGTAFYDFGNVAATTQLTQAYRAGLDGLSPDAATHRAIVDEALLAFELHLQLFDQLAHDVLRR